MKVGSTILLSFFIVLIVPGVNSPGLQARERTVTYGTTTWYTEQNSFSDILAIAAKENKPILANFSATWCRPCEIFKKTIFARENFKLVAKEVILLFIEQTEEKGMDYVNSYRVVVFPTFKMFSPDGTLLDSSFPGETVDAFIKWVHEVKVGNNYYELSLKLERNPKDRETLQKLLEKVESHEVDNKIVYLRRLIDIKPDPHDPITLWAYKKMLSIYPASLRYKSQEEAKTFALSHEDEYNRVLDICHPRLTGFTVADASLLADIIVWFNTIERYRSALDFFDKFQDVTNKKTDLSTQLPVYSAAMVSFIQLNRMADFQRLFKEVQDYIKKEKEIFNKPSFIIYYIRMYRVLIELFIEKERFDIAETYSRQLLDQAKIIKEEEAIKAYFYNLARRHGILADRMIKLVDQDIRDSSGTPKSNYIDIKAAILAKKGNKKQARQLLIDYYNEVMQQPDTTKRQLGVRAEILNTIAWAMVEMEMVDNKTLEIISRAVEIKEDPYNLDTLASVYALMGNLEKAIEIEKKALSFTENVFLVKEYKDKITAWENRLNQKK